MASKKKATDKSTPSSGKQIKWRDPKNYKSNTAITQKGQKATGLTKSNAANRFSSPAKTKVSSAFSMRASGTPLGTSMAINPLNKGQVANAVMTATGLRGSGQVVKAIESKAATTVGRMTNNATFKALTDNVARATGAGGKVKTVQTPFGPTLGSTKIGTAKQQAARIDNLVKGFEKTAESAGKAAARNAASTVRSTAKKGSTAKNAVIGGAVGNKIKKKK